MSSSTPCATPWKVAFDTRAAAERSLGKMRFRRHRREAGVAGRVQAFRCACGSWHVGHRKEKPR